jgi:hypothetical protein
VHFNPIMQTILYNITPRECINVSLKGSACIIVVVITGNVTSVKKGRTREFAREIIVVDVQPIF